MKTCLCYTREGIGPFVKVGEIELEQSEMVVGGWVVLSAVLYEIVQVWTHDGTMTGIPQLQVKEVN